MPAARALPRILLALALALPALAQTLPERIQAHLRAPRFEASRWGVHVVSLDSGRTLFQQDAGKFFLPASNAKLFICAMALKRLGPDRRFRTRILEAGALAPDGTLKGDLLFQGSGDPMLMARWRGGPGLPDPMEALAQQVKAAGIRVVEGDLVGDDRLFRTDPAGSGWEEGDREFAFAADVSALTVHDNVVDLRIYPGQEAGAPCFLFPMPGLGLLPMRNLTATGAGPGLRARWFAGQLEVTGTLATGAAPVTLAVPVREPALFAARLLRRALERNGIVVKGATVGARGRAPDGDHLPEAARLDSLPVRELVAATLKDSNNLYAQLLLLQAGGSEQTGLTALAAFLKEAGIRDGVVLEEGSGLSRKDLVKPEAVTALLAYMRTQPEGEAFAAALPVAAVDGTLRNRMGGTPAAGQLRAKTGTLRNTHALSGYVTAASGERLAFALILNNHVPPPGAPTAQADLDEVAALLAGWDGR